MEPAFERTYPGARKATKRHILSCALICFDERGFDAVTIDDIRRMSGASTGTIYHHFGNKEGLAAAIYLAALDDQQAAFSASMPVTGGVREAVAGWVEVYLRWVVENPRLARFMWQSRRDVAAGAAGDDLKSRNVKRFAALQGVLRKGVEAGSIRVLPPELYPSLLIGQSENYCRAWLSGRVKTTPLEHVDVFVDAAWKSIATAAHSSR